MLFKVTRLNEITKGMSVENGGAPRLSHVVDQYFEVGVKRN